jgi:hypothetical protein
MSLPPISRSPDLQALVRDGYEIAVVAGYLVVKNVPFVDRYRRVGRGTLVSRLDLAGDRTVRPGDHQAWFAGALPCDSQGRPLVGMVHANQSKDLGGGLRVDHLLCSRPFGREFVDYHEKIVTFVEQISSHAAALDPTVTARSRHVVAGDSGDTMFHYVDTATSRAGLGALADRLAGQSIGIVGLGGTGGYVLDLVAKTPVRSIHLFDDDVFLQHNAFRAPGAASVEDLVRARSKVVHFDAIYSRMHRGIVPHRLRMGPGTYPMLDHLDFVFLCMDGTEGKRELVTQLEDRELKFIDVGMGLTFGEGGLSGLVRVTTSTPEMRDHVWNRNRIPLDVAGAEDAYSTNVQVADLNALAAALAVVRWKRLCGFYADLEREHFATYAVDGNHLLTEEHQRSLEPDDPTLYEFATTARS